MLTPKVEERLSLLLKYHERGDMMPEEIGYCLALLVTANNLDEVLARLPTGMTDTLRQGLLRSTQDIAGDEHLHPERSPFDDMEHYHSFLQDAFTGDDPHSLTVLSVVCLPSFDPEWSLRLVKPAVGTYTLVLGEAQRQIWGDRSRETVPVYTFRASVTPDLADSLSGIWRRVLMGTRHSQSMKVGKDGVNYHFTDGWMAGRTWSPRADTPPGRLVALSRCLWEWVKAEEQQKGAIIAQVEDHLNWFRQHFGANMRTPSWTVG